MTDDTRTSTSPDESRVDQGPREGEPRPLEDRVAATQRAAELDAAARAEDEQAERQAHSD